MNFDEGFKLAWQTVKANKLRSFLTALGIIIGVMAVIGMMSIITALDVYMKKALSEISGNVFWVQKNPAVQMGRLDKKYRNRRDITFDEFERLETVATRYVEKVSPEVWNWGIPIKYQDESTTPNVGILGGDENWAIVNSRFVDEGRFITENDLHHSRQVVVLGKDIQEKLFPFTYPIGEFVKIGNKRFQVIGILEEKGEVFGESQDNRVVIPYTTFVKMYGHFRSVSIGIRAKNEKVIIQAMDEVEAKLRSIRKVAPGDETDFELITQDSIMDTLKNLTGFVFIAAVIICGISLLVGGIGIMNIMLVAVTERTREIGIRKAVGAKKFHILQQFLIEAVGICLFGGAIGVILGVLIGLLIAVALKLAPTIPVWSIFLGLGFSVAVGLVFGVYPAMKAAKLDPIEALRYE
ncbi:MAG: ABC transporter permease [Candidatus Marinimicrobia bacterium]|nr:ABC transporter permease [Candidatus Neomarinimicrobiota bacterium]